MCCEKKAKTCFVVLAVAASGSQVNLPDNNRLRDSKIYSIQMRRPAGATMKTWQGQTLVADTVTNTANLFLVNQSGLQIFSPLPCNVLQRDFNAPPPMQVNIEDLDPQQSYIQLDTTAVGYNSSHVFELIFEIECC